MRNSAANAARFTAEYSKDITNGYAYKEEQVRGEPAGMCHEPCCQILGLNPPHPPSHSQFGAELSDGAAPRVDLSKLKVSHRAGPARWAGMSNHPAAMVAGISCRVAEPVHYAAWRQGLGPGPPCAPHYTLGGPCPGAQVQALRKYTKVYEVPGISPQSSKEDLTSAVSKHWDSMVRGKGNAFAGPGAGACTRIRARGMGEGGGGARCPSCRAAFSGPLFHCRSQTVSEESVLQNLMRLRGRH